MPRGFRPWGLYTQKQMTKVIRRPTNGQSSPGGMDITAQEMEGIKEFAQSQIYLKGFSLGALNGQNPDLGPIALGGTARWLWGLQMWVTNANLANDDVFSLVINNETLIDGVLWKAFSPSNSAGMSRSQYFPLPRPLYGSDAVRLSWTAVGAKTVYPIFYLSNRPPVWFKP
jgi:hypothetical protein